MAATTVSTSARPRRQPLQWAHIRTVARTDLKQLAQARDYWIPMLILGGIFFVFVPTVLLLTITRIGSVGAVAQLSQALEILPAKAASQIRGDTETGRAAYALAVFLFAPVAVVVPITISTAVGAATIVGERERGTGEFLAHSPAGIREIFLGKLVASLIPGYLTTIVGFGIYSPHRQHDRRPEGGRLVLPHQAVVGADALGGAAVPGAHPLARAPAVAKVKSTAAAQQASALVSLPLIMVAYTQASGSLYGGDKVAWYIGGIAWVLAIVRPLAGRRLGHPRPPPRRRRRAVGSAVGVVVEPGADDERPGAPAGAGSRATRRTPARRRSAARCAGRGPAP